MCCCSSDWRIEPDAIMLHLVLMSLGRAALVVASLAPANLHACFCAWRRIATLIWWLQVPRLPPPTSPRPYAPAVPEVCGPQIVGCFRGPVGQLGSARPHPRSGGRERSSVGWGESGRVGRLRTGMRATSGLQRWRH